ncbi:hypothetical protein F5Y01DRAFT_64419 [Xylaria sp. FL0043]|nr:hypothetical protein F5Y01DRAFT_64419 [Xylaria sp. FL0043]
MAGSVDPDESDPYLLHLASKNKYEPWMKSLGKGTDYARKPIRILVLAASGSVEQLHFETHDLLTPALSTALTEKYLIDQTRLIIFNPYDRKFVQNHVGVVYDVDPGFFRAVQEICDTSRYPDEVPRCVPEFLVGGRPLHLDLDYGWTGFIHRNGNFNIVLVSALTFRGASFSTERIPTERNIYLDSIEPAQEYLHVLRKRGKNYFAEAHKDPLLLFLPVLEIHATYLYYGLLHANRRFRLWKEVSHGKDNDVENVENAWSDLRMMRHDGMGSLECIQNYDSNHNDGKLQMSEEYKDLVRRFGCIERQISRTEALARDYLQHQVGMLSLEESRSSIKQAKAAFEEGKRTKLITVLAIFFVPISLSTSVFGMNIHELNDSGQSVWVFILTTALIVAATITIWGIMYQFQKFHSLPKDDDKEGKHWPTRIYRLLQLVFRGHIIWAWKSGILISLLTDGRVAFIRSCTGHTLLRPDGDIDLHQLFHNDQWPCEYIRGHLRRFEGTKGFKCSELEGNQLA